MEAFCLVHSTQDLVLQKEEDGDHELKKEIEELKEKLQAKESELQEKDRLIEELRNLLKNQ